MLELLNNISYEKVVWIAAYLLIIILLILNLSTHLKLKKLASKYERFMSGLSDRNIEELIDSCLDDLDVIKRRNSEVERHINSIERRVLNCVQKTAIIRYNAFDNVGSDLSFSIALLDYNNDGIVFSSIYARESSTTYAKPIFGGKSKYALSGEEIQALNTAIKGHSEKSYIASVQSQP